jgi:hypothetical protein
MTAGTILRALGLLIVFWQPAGAQTCKDFAAGRKSTYALYSTLVLDDVRAIQKGQDINAAIGALATKYVVMVKSTGDPAAFRKLIALGLLTALSSDKEPQEATFKLVCSAAKLPPPNVLDPLTCAVVALDGSRRNTIANRTLAKAMVEVAKKNLARDSKPAAAQKLFDEISPFVLSCASRP